MRSENTVKSVEKFDLSASKALHKRRASLAHFVALWKCKGSVKVVGTLDSVDIAGRSKGGGEIVEVHSLVHAWSILFYTH
jgi:hypothetical protein